MMMRAALEKEYYDIIAARCDLRSHIRIARANMKNYDALINVLSDMEKVAKALGVEPFSMYFMGGSACILGKYNDRATRDFDFVDLSYPASLGKVIRYLSDFDMLEYESTILSPSYQTRAMKLEQFSFLNLYVLAKEDIIVSKVIRMEAKDTEDMDLLIGDCDKVLILSIIEDVLRRKDLYPSKREAFLKNLPVFREKYNV